jgi:hypothetical protein
LGEDIGVVAHPIDARTEDWPRCGTTRRGTRRRGAKTG